MWSILKCYISIQFNVAMSFAKTCT